MLIDRLTDTQRENKLRIVAENEGYSDIDEMLEDFFEHDDCIGICLAKDCSYICDNIEQDQTRGYCDSCKRNTVASVFVIRGVI